MPNPKRPQPNASAHLTQLAERPQVDFELDFYQALTERLPDYAEVLQALASNLSSKGLVKEGLKIDQRIVQLRPLDANAHYNLACRYALLCQPDLSIATLKRAVALGYRDFQFMAQDRDLESLRKDMRFCDLLKTYGMKP